MKKSVSSRELIAFSRIAFANSPADENSNLIIPSIQSQVLRRLVAPVPDSLCRGSLFEIAMTSRGIVLLQPVAQGCGLFDEITGADGDRGLRLVECRILSLGAGSFPARREPSPGLVGVAKN
jgi:hypothetical protein